VNTLYLYTIFESNKPRTVGIKVDDDIQIYDLFRPGARKPIKIINDNIKKIRELILNANDTGCQIVTSNFKNIITAFNLPLDDRVYNVYDIHLDNLNNIKSTNNESKDATLVRKILDKMCCKQPLEYQKLISNAAVVYQDMENRGIIINDTVIFPKWSMLTFSGRSKSTGFNIQGHYEEDKIRSINSDESHVLLHFDWISADIRVASMLSKDQALIDSFVNSDPYTYMMNILNTDNHKLSRDEYKMFLLKSINSMNNNMELEAIYPNLGKWIDKCYKDTRDSDNYLETIMQRRFKVSKAKNDLAVLNGVMQGSVAHAMHSALRRIWEKLGSSIITEIHDSIVLSIPNDGPVIRSTINIVSPIMMYPFQGLLPSNPCFPVSVSLGKKWKTWKLLEVHRSGGIERVQRYKTQESREEQSGEAKT